MTYIPLRKDFLYLVAVVDLFSRNVLSWKLTNSLDTEFCLEALEMALASGRKPQIFHSDQGYQCTSGGFVAQLKSEDIKISWSGRGRCFDNILVERLWRTVKYEEVYLRAYGDGWEAEISLARFFWRYGHVRPHSSLGGKIPHEVYTENKPCSSRPELTMSGAESVQKSHALHFQEADQIARGALISCGGIGFRHGGQPFPPTESHADSPAKSP